MVHVPVEDHVDASLGAAADDRIDDGLHVRPAGRVLLEVAAFVEVDGDPDDVRPPGVRGGVDRPAVAIEGAEPLQAVERDTAKLHRLARDGGGPKRVLQQAWRSDLDAGESRQDRIRDDHRAPRHWQFCQGEPGVDRRPSGPA